ncbi:MAG: hypothetical protein ACYC6M_05025 [Terriglobales bacterium]
MAKRQRMVLWGAHAATTGGKLIPIEDYTNKAYERRTKEGWYCFGVPEGEKPTEGAYLVAKKRFGAFNPNDLSDVDAAREYVVSKTYDVVTEESAANGDVSDSGFEFENEELNLRDAIRAITDLGAYEKPHASDGSVSVYASDAQQDYRTGAWTTYAVYIKSSPANIKRLLTFV